MDFSPPPPRPPYEVLKPFLMDYLLLHLHLLYSVSLYFPFHFINVSFTAFLSGFLWIATFYSSFEFLFWCGLDCACFVFEFMSSVSPS